ncbi:MAG: ABC transporter ATP-binding protein [Candidatus Riflebacteria bacterium]|nr:ABC transporter ATP-binding protein [Candidatus Riflebacteria bacterium]
MTEPILRLDKVSQQFGGLKAVSEFSLELHPGELVGIIGPNGAGKTTIFNLITGVYSPTAGDILLRGKRINGLASHVIAAAGISRTFQNIRLFRSMTVLDNVKTAFNARVRYSMLDVFLGNLRYLQEERDLSDKAWYLLERFGLEDRARERSSSLPYGLQRKLEIARALACNPSVLLLDEPAAGMNPLEIDELIELVLHIKTEFEPAILLIEHQMKVVRSLCERVKVLDFGLTIAEGPPREVSRMPRVLEAYLGEPDEPASAAG